MNLINYNNGRTHQRTKKNISKDQILKKSNKKFKLIVYI